MQGTCLPQVEMKAPVGYISDCTLREANLPDLASLVEILETPREAGTSTQQLPAGPEKAKRTLASCILMTRLLQSAASYSRLSFAIPQGRTATLVGGTELRWLSYVDRSSRRSEILHPRHTSIGESTSAYLVTVLSEMFWMHEHSQYRLQQRLSQRTSEFDVRRFR